MGWHEGDGMVGGGGRGQPYTIVGFWPNDDTWWRGVTVGGRRYRAGGVGGMGG